MQEDLAGRTVRSLAGHDSGQLYIVLRTDGAFVYLSDGRRKPREGPKKKKIRYVEVLSPEFIRFTKESVETALNEDIRRALRSVRKALA